MDADDADHMAYLESRYNTATVHNQIMDETIFLLSAVIFKATSISKRFW